MSANIEQNVAILGLGYVGCVSAACFAHIGHRVTGIDKDEFKVRSVLEGRAPFYEPGLEEMVKSGVAAGRLGATTSVEEGVHDADVALICVGTPSEKNGNLGLGQLRKVVEEIAATLSSRTKPLVVAVRSTVFPGTCEEVVMPALGDHPMVRVVSNPEFLREGAAMKDFMEPSLVVVGGHDAQAVARVASIYAPLNVPPCLVSLRTAEMIKYACNAFHAVKVAFANEIGALAARLGVDGHEVMETLCKDDKLNTSAAYLKPGFAFGGSCLPKDLRALTYRALRMDLKLPLLESTLPSNEWQLQRAVHAVLDLPPGARPGIFGLAFKENTDDLRESPVVNLVEQLIGKGRELRIYDPHIQLDAIYGANKSFVLSAIPHIGRLMDRALEDMLAWSTHIVVAQKPSREIHAVLAAQGKPIIDLVGAFPGQPA
ncbi:MAG: UDP-glucose/GDP-mannose dehydrogenase family protein [Acidobacteria bacterium]|nr:UDP-glucose/GDP-mannose dehydrogenase family protein [Acidobacteriota bacterium]